MEADTIAVLFFFSLLLSSAVPAFNKAFCEWAGDKGKEGLVHPWQMCTLT